MVKAQHQTGVYVRLSKTMSSCLFIACALLPLTSCSKSVRSNRSITAINKTMSNLPRYQQLPIFDPHRKTFECVYQAQHLPLIDPQAELWFQQAVALDQHPISDEDLMTMYKLYKKSAERKHWKAMLALSDFILQHYENVATETDEDAIQLVEQAMQMGVPAAYDRMGQLYMNGTVSHSSENQMTMAYAFYQKAADMGNPDAQAYLGDQLDAVFDAPGQGYWANRPIGVKMMKCSFAQGNPKGAYNLGMDYATEETSEDKAMALKVWHEGVKFGSEYCAGALMSDFSSGARSAPHGVDLDRKKRYSVIAQMLSHYGVIKLPNLDKVLPLPPAKLPVWNGDEDTLFDAAKAVVPPTVDNSKPTPGANLQGRAHIPQGHIVNREPTGHPHYENTRVPTSAYWLPVLQLEQLSGGMLGNEKYYRFNKEQVPLFFKEGEQFNIEDKRLDANSPRLLWFYLGPAVAKAAAGPSIAEYLIKSNQARQVEFSKEIIISSGDKICNKTGIWYGKIDAEHPLAKLFNRWDRQTFVEKGAAFPNPEENGLAIKPEQITWRYIGQQNADKGDTGIKEITL